MIFEHIFNSLFVFTTVTTGMVAGIALTFAIVVMPGIHDLGDREFINAFQKMDGVIQKGHPVFITVWLGSIVSFTAVALMGFWLVDEPARWFIIGGWFFCLVGVQLPTAAVNVPLNNELQELRTEEMSPEALGEARLRFEPRWNRWNVVRTVVSVVVTLLLVLILRVL